MMRGAVLPVAIGLAGLAALAACWLAGWSVLPSYLAAWLIVLACPLGALPLVMAHDLTRRAETPVVAALRAMLPLALPGLAMAVPVMAQRASLYPTAATLGGFAGAWMAPGAILVRALVATVAWLALAAVFWRPATRRAALRSAVAGFGLLLHLGLGTLLVTDWVADLDPGFTSASLPLTVLVAQAVVALAIAIVMTARRPAMVSVAGLGLLWLFGAWLFLQFSQYLVVWSANLPTEVPWYLARDGGLGGAAEAAAALVFVAALLVLPRSPGPGATTAIAAAILAVQAVAFSWLVVPVSRGAFTVSVADLAAAVGLAGLAAAALMALAPAANVPEGVR